MSSPLSLVALLAFLACVPAMGLARDLGAVARVDPAESGIVASDKDTLITLALSQPVPWRVFTLDNPRRLVVDLSEVIWPPSLPGRAGAVEGMRMGVFQPGWSRMVIDLAGPYAVSRADLETGREDGSARLTIRLSPSSTEDFAAAAGTPPSAVFTSVAPVPPEVAPVNRDDGVLRVILDPGHGGLDPGAEAGGLVEADLMLTFARELRELLRRDGRFSVEMTRDSDVFVPLETRITLARLAGAEVFLSLHADALPADAGTAHGATVYTLSDEASDLASQKLAERHDQSDLLAGVDLSGQGDEIALVLMDLARRETAPRADHLADALVDGISAATGRMNSNPKRSAAFSVLKAPDFPSVLVELGFLSSERDRRRLADPGWRKKMAEGIRDSLAVWAEEDALRASLLRQ